MTGTEEQQFLVLRDILAKPPSSLNFEQLVAFLLSQELDFPLLLAYALEHLESWDDSIRAVDFQVLYPQYKQNMDRVASLLPLFRILRFGLKGRQLLAQGILIEELVTWRHMKLEIPMYVYSYSKERGGWYSDMEDIEFHALSKELEALKQWLEVVTSPEVWMTINLKDNGQWAENHRDIQPFFEKEVKAFQALTKFHVEWSK